MTECRTNSNTVESDTFSQDYILHVAGEGVLHGNREIALKHNVKQIAVITTTPFQGKWNL